MSPRASVKALALVLAATSAASCAGAARAERTEQAAPPSAAAASPAAASRSVDAGVVIPAPVAREPSVVLFFDMTLLRRHPQGPRIGPLLATIPTVAALEKRSPGFDVVRDAAWLVLAASDLDTLARSPTVIAHLVGDDRGASAFGAVARLDAARPPLGPVRVRAGDVAVAGERGASLGGDVARFDRPPAEASGAALWLWAKGGVLGVKSPLLAGAGDVTVRVEPLASSGEADARADVLYDDEEGAGAFASRARAAVAGLRRQAFVRMLLRGLADGIDVSSDGRRGHAKVHARAEQLAALMNLLEASLGVPAGPSGAPVPPPSPPPP